MLTGLPDRHDWDSADSSNSHLGESGSRDFALSEAKFISYPGLQLQECEPVMNNPGYHMVLRGKHAGKLAILHEQWPVVSLAGNSIMV